MIEKFCKQRKMLKRSIIGSIFAIILTVFPSLFVFSIGIIYSWADAWFCGGISAVAALIFTGFFIKYTIEDVVYYRKSKLEIIRILDKFLQEKEQ